jgi:hypothetical protein
MLLRLCRFCKSSNKSKADKFGCEVVVKIVREAELNAKSISHGIKCAIAKTSDYRETEF